MIVEEKKILYSHSVTSKRLWSINEPEDIPIDVKGLYCIILDYNIINKHDYSVKEDNLLCYYRYYGDDNYHLYFKSEENCLLWRLKYAI